MSAHSVSEDKASAHEKAQIILRLSENPEAGTKVLVAFYKTRWISSTDTEYYITYARAIAHLLDDKINVTFVRLRCGTPESFYMQFDGGPWLDSPKEIFQYTSRPLRWWFPDAPIPDEIELRDEYGQRINVIQL